MKISEQISVFLKFIDSINAEYDRNFQIVGLKDKEGQDDFHNLELGELKYKERAKLATKIQNDRIERRKAKDACAVLEPLCEFLKDESHKRTLNKLRNTLGDIRKIEDRLENRTYNKRAPDK